MRKLKLCVQHTLDGFHSRIGEGESWGGTRSDPKSRAFLLQVITSSDTVLLGRGMADGFIRHWESIYTDPSHPAYDIAVPCVESKKVVFTKTMTSSPWNNTTLATGDLREEVAALKAEKGSDIIVYGGTTFAGELLKEDVIDEFYFFIYPLAIGKGNSIFSSLHADKPFELKRSIAFDCGIVLLQYDAVKN